MAERRFRGTWVDFAAILLVAAHAMPKLFYKPLGILLGIVAGRLAGKLFKRAWELAAPDERPSPQASERDRDWGEIVAAAVIRGAVFSGVRAVINRAGATGFERVTGSWPGTVSTRTPPGGTQG
jgi:hypothetical protein